MPVSFRRSLLAAALPLGYALQVDASMNTCPWIGFSLDFEQSMCAYMELEAFADESGEYRRDSLEHNNWRTFPDCFDDYCVYTNDNFHGKGLSLITTASNHHRVKELQIPQTALELGYEKTRIAEIPDKGRGLIATKTIRKGERILAAKPALLVHRDAFRQVAMQDMFYLMDLAVSNLPKARRESYMGQAGSMGSHKITDILFTNSFQVTLGGHDGFHYANFPEVSVLNHDCRPNMAFFIDGNLTHHTHAVRDISPGEELTISYVDALQIRSERQERTRNSLGFSCTCSQCTLPKEELDASDDRIRTISRIERELSNVNSKEPSPAMIEEYIALYKTEGLDHNIAGAYTLAALNYNFLGKATLAKKCARLSAEAGRLENGPDAGDVREMTVLAEDPESHWSWKAKADRL
ncbi:hypothetical protein NPX13_g7571 [Xylaria arbuscula]|uniref:SET domain-containing protein n=1 Tax=Xylaria arbuscula TaxID=114810 RepID=A0A9W8NAF4_9PEZI|nr:hypothetical protein NPX13_g7571 [Xylaria arbuscula]